jgi:hypothetical protein
VRKRSSVGREEYVTASDRNMPARTVAQNCSFCAISLFHVLFFLGFTLEA